MSTGLHFLVTQSEAKGACPDAWLLRFAQGDGWEGAR